MSPRAGATRTAAWRPRCLHRAAAALLVSGCAVIAWPAATQAAHDTPSPGVAEREIAGLIDGLATSGCRFQRNGTWHDADEASIHLRRKYDWAKDRGMVGSADDFIARAASRSSFSGRAYQVECPGQPRRDAGPWFSERLKAMRSRAAAR